jgi:hypothetical protein
LKRSAGNRATFAAGLFLKLLPYPQSKASPLLVRSVFCVNCYMWISGPKATVHEEYICHELTAVAKIGLATSRWLSERTRSAGVALGNHPIRVRPPEGFGGER